MQEELQFYKSTKDTCACGETALLSSILGVDIPCSHRVHLGAHFTELSRIDLKLVPCTNECVFKYTVVNREPPNTDADHINCLKNSAICAIRRYSHFKHKSTISKFVEDNFNSGAEFVNGKPLEYYSLVNEGIIYFNKIRYQKEYEKKSYEGENDKVGPSSDATDSD